MSLRRARTTNQKTITTWPDTVVRRQERWLTEGFDRFADALDSLFDAAARTAEIEAHVIRISKITPGRHTYPGVFKELWWIFEAQCGYVDPGQIGRLDRRQPQPRNAVDLIDQVVPAGRPILALMTISFIAELVSRFGRG